MTTIAFGIAVGECDLPTDPCKPLRRAHGCYPVCADTIVRGDVVRLMGRDWLTTAVDAGGPVILQLRGDGCRTAAVSLDAADPVEVWA